MADKKISALTAATLPLAGTEVLPIVQSGSTVKVATDDLTVKNLRSNATTGILQIAGPAAAATRTMTVPDANFTAARTDAANSFTADQTLATGNLVIGTAGKGIDFSATSGTGTSELLADYEEGLWTPTFSSTGASFSYTTQYGTYTKVGRLVMIQFYLQATASGTTSNQVDIASLPFTSANINNVVQCAGSAWFSGPKSIALLQQNNSTTSQIWQNGTTSTLTAADVSTYYLVGSIVYQAA